MRTQKSFAAGLVLSIFLAISVSAGEMPGPGFVQDPPKTKSATARTSTDLGHCAAQTGTTTCEEATTDLAAEATIIAMQLLTSVW